MTHSKTIQTNTVNGPMFVYEDDHIGKILIEHGAYEQEYCNMFIQNVAEPNATVIDVGANIGTFTIPFAANFARVIAFEPQKAVSDLLEMNLELNNLENVSIIHSAAGHYEGSCALRTEGIEGNLGQAQVSNVGEPIAMTTIDNLKLKQCHGIKVDVEGAERLVIYGAQETIKKYKPVLLFEHTGLRHFEDKNFILNSDIHGFDILEFLLFECNYKRIIKLSKNILALP